MAAAFPSRLAELSSISTSTAGRVLVFSGDDCLAAEIREYIGSDASAVLPANSSESLIQIFRADSTVDLVLLDSANDSEQFGSWLEQMSSLREATRKNPNLDAGGEHAVVLLLVDTGRIPQAIRAIEAGDAYDYLVRPFAKQQLQASIRKAIEYRQLRLQNDRFRHHLDQLITARTKMLQQTMAQLEQSYDITLEALGNALDLKDAETEGHSKRVTAYTLALGRALGLNEPQLRIVGRGAFLHDIGKMAIPDAILRKPGKLTAEEREIMRTHSELGYRMVRKIPYLREAAEIVYAHQECFDGSGYPRGLRGEQIHIGARIFALADTLDAITSNRPYRKAATVAQARKEVLRCAGTQFDPAIVDVFVATPDSIWLNLREGIMRDGPEFSPFGYTFGEVT